jgi:hypothetical protein
MISKGNVVFALMILGSLPATADNIGSVCDVSIPSATLPGDQARSSLSWFGSQSLAVAIPHSGIWHGMGPENDFSDKLFWIADGFKPGLESNFSLTGRHLQYDSFTPIISEATNARSVDFGGTAILVGVGFPVKGCWELTGTFQSKTLTFVVDVK